MPENQITTNFIYLTSSNFVTISHINDWDQVNYWKNVWKFWNGLLCRNKSGPSPYSILQYTGRAATPKLVLKNCLKQDWQWEKGDWSQNLCRYYKRYCRYQISAKTENLIFWTKFNPKEYFQSLTVKVSITIKFCRFELVWISKKFWILRPNLAKKVFSIENGKKWTSA